MGNQLTRLMSTADVSIPDQAKKTGDQRYLDISTVYDPGFFKGKKVVITGGNRGLGFEITKVAKAAGAEVIVMCRSAGDKLDGLATAYEGVDVTNEEAVNEMAKKVVAAHGPIDVLINNAGYFYGPEEKVLDGTLNFDEELKQINVCALGPLRVTAAFVKQGGLAEGAIVTIITSQAGSVEWRFTQNPEGGDYGHHMSRAACNIMGALLSQELKQKKIPVILLHPGFNRTGMTKKYEHIWDAEGAVPPEQGAKRVLYEVSRVTMETTGSFINCEDGKVIPW